MKVLGWIAISLGGLLLVLFLAFCAMVIFDSGLYPEDEQLLETLRDRFGDRYGLYLINDIVMTAEYKLDGEPPRDELIRIYQTFFLNPDGTQRQVRYGDLCVFDKSHRFLYAVDSHEPGKFEFTQEHSICNRRY